MPHALCILEERHRPSERHQWASKGGGRVGSFPCVPMRVLRSTPASYLAHAMPHAQAEGERAAGVGAAQQNAKTPRTWRKASMSGVPTLPSPSVREAEGSGGSGP